MSSHRGFYMLEADRVAREVAAANGSAIAVPVHTAMGTAVHRLYWHGRPADTYRSESGARHAADMLNRGAATLNPHGSTGARVVPIAQPRAA